MMRPESAPISPPQWRPIEDLPADWERLHTDQLRSLGDVWRRQREAQLEDSDVLREFNERLSRQWAIETGIIEGLYTIDRGTTQVLIEHGIVEKNIPHTVTNRPLTLVAMLQDHQMVLEGAFDFVQQRRSLSTSYIKEIHAALTQHQPTTEAIDSLGRIATVELLRGEWKRHANNPTRPDGLVHPYCPPEHVAAEMDRLIAMHLQHMEQGVAPEVEAAWLHHRFTQIHPFQDGNGRVARVLASLVFLRAGWFPLGIDRDQRGKYIDALELADRGILADLVSLFARVQEREFFNVFVQLDKISSRYVGKQTSKQNFEYLESQLGLAIESLHIDLLQNLIDIVHIELNQSAVEIRRSSILIEEKARLELAVVQSNYGQLSWADFALETGIIADEAGYYANSSVYRQSVALTVKYADYSDRVAFSLHGFGHKFIGLFAMTAYRERLTEGFSGMRQITGPFRLSDSVFVFAQDESPLSAADRLRAWIKPILTEILA